MAREEWVLWCRMNGRALIRYRIGSHARVMREAESVVHSPIYSDWRIGRPGEPVEQAVPLRWTRRGFEPVTERCPLTGRSATACDSQDHRNCPDLEAI